MTTAARIAGGRILAALRTLAREQGDPTARLVAFDTARLPKLVPGDPPGALADAWRTLTRRDVIFPPDDAPGCWGILPPRTGQSGQAAAPTSNTQPSGDDGAHSAPHSAAGGEGGTLRFLCVGCLTPIPWKRAHRDGRCGDCAARAACRPNRRRRAHDVGDDLASW